MRYPSSKPKPSAPSALAPPATPSEESQASSLREQVLSQTTPAPSASERATFLTDATLTRYLRARSHDEQKAAAMLCASIVHARTNPALRACPACVNDPASHSFFPIGPAFGVRPLELRDATPVMYSNFLVRDRHPPTVTLHMQSAMDAAFDPSSLHRMVWVMDFHGFSRSDMSPTQARKTLTLFANHYPERLGCAVIYDAPRAFSALWAAVKLFAAPETVAKVVFVSIGEEEHGFATAGVVGDTFDRVMEEIRLARNGGQLGSWWARSPISPLVDYGARLLEAKVKEAELHLEAS